MSNITNEQCQPMSNVSNEQCLQQATSPTSNVINEQSLQRTTSPMTVVGLHLVIERLGTREWIRTQPWSMCVTNRKVAIFSMGTISTSWTSTNVWSSDTKVPQWDEGEDMEKTVIANELMDTFVIFLWVQCFSDDRSSVTFYVRFFFCYSLDTNALLSLIFNSTREGKTF